MNGTNSQVQFRFQRPANNIYRVGPVGSNFFFTSIQTAINAAVADGHTDNTVPAIIEIYPGTYIENPVLASGVHLKGVGSGVRNVSEVVINGVVTYSPAVGTILQNVVNIYNLSINAQDTLKAIVFSGAGASRLNLRNCAINSSTTGAGTTGLIVSSNTGASSSFRMTDCQITGNNAGDNEYLQASAGTTEFYGGQGGVNNGSGANQTTAINVSGTATVNVRQAGFSTSSFTQFFIISGAGAVLQVERANIQNNLAAGAMFNFTAAGNVRCHASGLFVAAATAKLATGAAGTLLIDACRFNGTIPAPFTLCDTTLSVFAIGPSGQAPFDSRALEFQVGRGTGYGSIQAAITAAAVGATATAPRRTVKIPPGSYTENLVLAANVDLVADTYGLPQGNIATVFISGNHSYASATAGASINMTGLSFSSVGINATALFTFTGNAAGNVKFRNCTLTKTSTAGASQIISSTSTGALNFILDYCTGQLTADGGTMFDFSGALNASLYIENEIGVSGSAYLFSQLTAGVPNTNVLLSTCTGGFGNTYNFTNLTMGAFTSRMFLFNSSDRVLFTRCYLQPVISAGEVFKFVGNATLTILNSTVIISGDGVQLGVPVTARDNGTQATGQFNVIANPAIGDTVTVGAQVFTFGPGIGQVAIGANQAATAANLANAINFGTASTYATNLVAGSQLVNVYATDAGAAGNAIAFSSATAAITASGAGTLAGGAGAASGGSINTGACAFNRPNYQASLISNAIPTALVAV